MPGTNRTDPSRVTTSTGAWIADAIAAIEADAAVQAESLRTRTDAQACKAAAEDVRAARRLGFITARMGG